MQVNEKYSNSLNYLKNIWIVIDDIEEFNKIKIPGTIFKA